MWLPSLRGRAVTRKELAEAIGVSRVRYAMLESGAAVNTLPSLLARLAETLDLSAEHRKLLFELALPDLSASLSSFTLVKQLTKSIVPLRAAARQLWSATTAEILLVVRRVDREGDLAQCGGVLHRLAAIFIRIQIVIIA